MEAWRWDLIRDAWLIALCIGMLVCLVRRRGMPLPAPEERAARLGSTGFSQEIRLQAMRQQSERALASILAAVDSERRRLQQLFDADDRPPPAVVETSARAATDDFPFRLGEAREPAAWGPYESVHGLSREGLSSRQIAEKLNLPRGEVELALKLRAAAG
jgi:hypothetical protein